jgi:hypothetical protein
MEMINQMFKNMWNSFIIAMELSAYQKTLRECYGVLGPEQIKHIRKKIDELTSR